MFKRRRNRIQHEVAPDEIFLDSHNIPQFDQQQFEGRIERPISSQSISLLGVLCAAIALIFVAKIGVLQVGNGDVYAAMSEKNTLARTPLFADRGVIFDRSGEALSWNSKSDTDELSERLYTDRVGFAHVLGYVRYPKQDSSGFYWQDHFEGRRGIEKHYDAVLRGENGSKIVEKSAQGDIISQNLVARPIDGDNLTLTIDAPLQEELFSGIADLAERGGYSGGAGVIMDVDTGALVAMTSFPEYDSEVLSQGKERDAITNALSDERNPFLNRVTNGLYTPGSIVKPYIALGALAEDIIDPQTQHHSTGSISIPNRYNPDQPTIFRDWKEHGWIDMRGALAHSSNTYFYTIGGGYEDQEGLGISRIEYYTRLFGVAEPTGIPYFPEEEGVIPTPDWKAQTFADDQWRVGDTYNTAIGQYGFQVTPLEMVRSIGAVANQGVLHTPHLVASTQALKEQITEIDPTAYEVIHEGMRQAVTEGTAVALNVAGTKAAAKTGTAELGSQKKRINSWVVGFYPYDDPQYAFAVLMERGPADDTIGASHAFRPVLEWIAQERR